MGGNTRELHQYVVVENTTAIKHSDSQSVSLKSGELLVSYKNINTTNANNNSKNDISDIGLLWDPNSYLTIPECKIKKRTQVDIAIMPWYFGRVSDGEVAETLRNSSVGTFLVKESNINPGTFTLVIHNGTEKPSKYRLFKNNEGYLLGNQHCFESINHLIQFYSENYDGLIVKLLTIANRNKLSDKIFWEKFTESHWTLNENDVKIGQIIDEGDFGIVKEGKYLGRPVAVKLLKDEKKHIDAFYTEAAFMTMLSHKNIVSLIGLCKINKAVHVLVEYCSNGSLLSHLQTKGRNALKKSNLISYAAQLAYALDYLSSIGLVHRDVAARNVLLTDKMEVKLSDFGLIDTTFRSLKGGVELPIRWTSPEVLQAKYFSEFSDVWSFGVVLWEIFSYGRTPYPKWQNENILKNLIKGKRMEAPEGCPHEIAGLMHECWNIYFDRRPRFAEISEYLEKLDIYHHNISP